jgi:glycolate oxidase iron-sulfur subunit
MQTHIAAEFAGTADGQEAEAILRKCVHCGFCTATCPTYQLLGDELDGPRGRIYLIKQVLEGHAPTRATQLHLDRCLTCRNCETTCPSGVQYGNLVEIGRRIVDERVPRPASERALRWTLKEGLTSPAFGPAMKIGQAVRAGLPAALKAKVPAPAPRGAQRWPTHEHPRKVLLLLGCVQPAMMPNINSATARVLDAAGIQTLVADDAGCCGAIRLHLGDRGGALEHMRRNIDAWWPMVQSGAVEAIVMNASGCGVTVKEYGHSLAHDPEYANKANRIADLTRDLSELLPDLVDVLRPRLALPRSAGERGAALSSAGRVGRIAFHPPCTLQHGQRLRGGVETALNALGFEVHIATNEAHLCCGSAGTYSVFQPELANALRDRKLANLDELAPSTIVSANIGCIQHLQSGTTTPVRHWVEVLDEALAH